MDHIVITGVQPWDGRYELDLINSEFKTREWGWIKRYANYGPATLDGTALLTDPEMVTLCAIIAMHRAGKIEIRDIPDMWERFADVPFGAAIKWEFGDRDELEDDAAHPTESSSANGNSSGAGSRTGSGSLADPLSPTGHQSSATSPSDQPTLVS